MKMDEIIKDLDENLVITKTEKTNGTLYFYGDIKPVPIPCKYCGEESQSIHSKYTRIISDLPIQNYQVKLVIKVPKYFCRNKGCSHKTFAYPIWFAEKNSLRTQRLDDYIYPVGLKTSSLSARNQISDSHVSISNNTILRIIKKSNPCDRLPCKEYSHR